MTRHDPSLIVLGKEVEAVQNLIEHLRSLDIVDSESIIASVESETNLKEVFEKFLLEEAEADADITKIKALIETYKARKERYEKRKALIRDLMAVALLQVNLPSLRTAFGTTTLKITKGEIIVADEQRVPTDYFKSLDPVIDKKALNEAFEANEAKRAEAYDLARMPFLSRIQDANEIENAEQRALVLADIDAELAPIFKKIDEEIPPLPGVVRGEPGTSLSVRRK